MIGHTDHASQLSYSPNGKYIICGSHDSTIRRWAGNCINKPLRIGKHKTTSNLSKEFII